MDDLRRALPAAALALGLCLAACGGSPDAPAATATRADAPTTTAAPSGEPKTVRVGEPWNDTYTNGDSPEMVAQVTVTKLACAITSIRTEDPPKVNRPTADQEFCRAWYTIKNVGRTPLNWTGSPDAMQVETDAGMFESDDLASAVTYALSPKADDPVHRDPAFAGSELNPGGVGQSTQVWQVPAGSKLVGLVFRHYPYSPPVVVKG
jgi:hypothetical protein